jgi:CheY-like chemotaxis protein
MTFSENYGAVPTRKDVRRTHDPMTMNHAAPAVLIVEDDRDLASAISETIDALGYRAICARDGGEAMAALNAEAPAVMLVDLFMPRMSGAEFLALVRKSSKWSCIPRVIITGTNDPTIGIRQDTPVLFKPFELDTLTRLVQRYCEPDVAHPPIPLEATASQAALPAA